MGNVIQSYAAANILPSVKAIREEVLRQSQHQQLEEHGTCVSKERWEDHQNEADMVREAGLAYIVAECEGREVHCPICLQYRVGYNRVSVTVTVFHKLCYTKRAIGRHLNTHVHKATLDEKPGEEKRQARRVQIGLTIAKIALQILREGSTYVQFEKKLLTLHLLGQDIGSMNHSR
jgi:hypothetical protein